MKRILITGQNSYTGRAIREHLATWPGREKYQVETISVRGDSWKSESFAGFDTVIHTAGIAHDSTRSSLKDDYYRVNSELAFDVARKAMKDGVSQFVFMSSSIVYGRPAPIGKTRVITRGTPVMPASYYGDSKVRAENMILPLDSEKFRVCVLRCPMIYGKGCRGNYRLLSRLGRWFPLFPKIHNTRSMLYVKNFAQFVKLMIDGNEHGIFWPQNGEYSCTSEMVKMIAESHGRKMLLLPGCDMPLRFLARFSGMVNKAFGSLAYDMSLSSSPKDYRLYSLRTSIDDTERG